MAQGKTIQDQLAKAGVICSVRQIRRTRAFSATFSAPDCGGRTAPAEVWATKIQAIIPTAKIVSSSNILAPWRGVSYILMANVQFMVGESR